VILDATGRNLVARHPARYGRRRGTAAEALMSSSDSTAPASGQERTWVVHRQDDNGCRFVVRVGLSREEAERLVKEFEALGHKQTYWAEPERR
jgi:hypothetical protein